MLLDPQRAQAKLDEALARIRKAQRMRFGMVAGVVIVGLLQVAVGKRPVVEAGLPVLGLAVAGAAVIQALSVRDAKRAQRTFESESFRVPKRKTLS